MDVRRVFAQNLRRLRVERGYSQEMLADAASIDRTYVSSLERELYSPTIDMLGKLADVLGVAPHELLLEG
jgi:transcriptional regulator with XRE-family HTH domain